MTRTIWTAAVLVAGTAATALLLSQRHLSDADRALTVTKPQPAPDVRVRHDFISIALPAAAPIVSPRRSQPASSMSPMSAMTGAPSSLYRPSSSRVLRSGSDDTRLLSKVRRVVAGDGRYRPEPFPRVK